MCVLKSTHHLVLLSLGAALLSGCSQSHQLEKVKVGESKHSSQTTSTEIPAVVGGLTGEPSASAEVAAEDSDPELSHGGPLNIQEDSPNDTNSRGELNAPEVVAVEDSGPELSDEISLATQENSSNDTNNQGEPSTPGVDVVESDLKLNNEVSLTTTTQGDSSSEEGPDTATRRFNDEDESSAASDIYLGEIDKKEPECCWHGVWPWWGTHKP